MNYNVIEKYQTLGVTWYVRVQISEEESTFFTFADEPTDEQIQITTQTFIDNRIQALLDATNVPATQGE